MKILFLLLLFSCTDILIQENENYKSVHLNNGGWISIPNQNYDLDKGLEIINDQFTLEIYFSGGKNNINTAGAIFSIMDNNDNNFIALGAFDDPSVENVLSLYINDNEQEISIDGVDFSNSDEFHLLQVLATQDSIKFYLDNNLIYLIEANISVNDPSLLIGAKGNNNFADKMWKGYIDEVRLWNSTLTDDIREMHYNSPSKLVETMQDSSICNLTGLWSFNYSKETYNIIDEKCIEATNLYHSVCDFDICNYPLDGILYTLPDSDVRFSRKSF